MATPRVIVVDSAADSAATLAAYLGLRGYETRTAGDGRTALELTRAWPVDGVVSDIELPHLTGLELALSLRSDFGESIRLVAFTAEAGRRDHDLAFSGFDEVILKPAEPSTVFAALAPSCISLIARARQASVQQLDLTLNLAESFLKLQRIVPPSEPDVVARLAVFVRSGLSRAVISDGDKQRLAARLKEMGL